MGIIHTAARLRRVLAGVTAAAIGAALLTPVTASADESTPPPEIVRTVSDAGFAHPGVGLTADNLENMRTQVQAGVEPWASYYAAMTQTRYASTTYRSDNAGASDDAPLSDAYDNATMRTRALRDSIGAMTQALEYVVTGDEVYRANALHVIRSWSSLDPAKYQYFADAHIHTGMPLYQMLVAAEIIRSTEPAHAELDGYDLTWTERDQQRIEDNFVRPVLDTFLYSQNRLWNQHLYGLAGEISAAIFLDDADLYAQRVEWFTVNSTYQSEHTINGGDVNGALASLFRVIDVDDPLNPYGTSFVQHMEMGRDQAHAEGDVGILTALARIVNNQGTKVDPVAGTVSTAPDAVTAYAFLDDRILAGGDVWAAYMQGEEIPYIDTSGGSGKLSQAYRGRLRDPLSELYLQYEYIAGVDVEAAAPHVADLYAHRDGPLYYYGTGVENFWNERGSDFTGAEYWVAFPPELADEDVTVPPVQAGPELAVSQFGHPIGDGAVEESDDDGTGFVRLDAAEGPAQLAVRRAVWSDRATTSLVGVRVRTEATGVLQIARSTVDDRTATLQVPDTGGQWRYVWFDLDSRTIPSVPAGDNIVVLRAVEGSRVDVAGVLAQANGTLTPPRFEGSASLGVVAVAGEEYTRTFTVTDAGGAATLTLQDGPAGATLSSAGVLTWPSPETGQWRPVVVASDDRTDTALPVSITVAPDRQAAVQVLLDRAEAAEQYTTASWARVVEARDAALGGVDDADAATFGDLLENLRIAVDDLELLNPRLADGTLDYSQIVTSPQISATTLAALTDGDNQTTWGDQRVQSVVLDFGPAYRVRADGFGLLARDTFPNRGEGTNVYGSDDGSTWTLLTEHPNVGDDVAIEQIPVRAQARDLRFRFLKLQVDEPGVPSDPAYPGIWTLADFRIDGERAEAVGSMDSVHLQSADAVAGRVVPGDVVEVRFTGSPQSSGIAATIAGQSATVTEEQAGSWTARATLPEDGAAGVPVTFAIAFTTPEGAQADPVVATTDGSSLFWSTDEGLVDDAFRTATVVGPDGQPSAALAANAAQLFDGNAATHSDTRAVNGVFAMTWDFGEGSAVSLTGAEIRVRQDGYGISRISNMRLEGSNDLSTWTRLTPAVPRGTLDWQLWPVSGSGSYRYVRLVNGAIIGVAELRLHGGLATDSSTEAPGQGTLWSDSGWATGLSDGSYTVTMSLWWGSNATRVELYENGGLIDSRDVAAATPQAQHVAVPVTGRADGTYEYVAVLRNRNGSTTTQPLVVQVTDASPGAGALSHDNGDGDGDYTVNLDLWWGTNASTYRLYEDGVLVDTQTLVAATPGAQHAATGLTGREAGQHVYRGELENSVGVTQTAQLVVDVR